MTILLVEDDEVVRDSLCTSFEQRGWPLISFATGEECIEKLGGRSCDIIISDYLLPEMDGIELIRRLGDGCKGAAKILITAYGNEKLLSEAIEAGVDDVIDKPFSMKTLEESISRSIGGRSGRQALQPDRVGLRKGKRRFTMPKKDFIIGDVREIVGDNMFYVAVNRVGEKNRGAYGDVEMVWIKTLKVSEIVTLSWEREQLTLEKLLKGREVMCVVHSRGENGEIKADVYMNRGLKNSDARPPLSPEELPGGPG